MSESYRLVLRNATRCDHEQVDRLFSELDISERHGFIHFGRVHLACFATLKERAVRGRWSAQLLDNMICSLARDLRLLNCHGLPDARPYLRAVDPLAIDYVVAGSRLGSKILKTRWAKSTDSTVRDAGSYFGMDGETRFWQDTCRALSQVPVDTPRATAIIDDTKEIFRIFVSTFKIIGSSAGHRMPA